MYFVVTWAMIYASRNILLVLPWVIDSKSIKKCLDYNYTFYVLVTYLKSYLFVSDSPGFGIIDLESDQG